MLQKFIDRRALSTLTGMLKGPLKSMVFWAAFCLGAVLPGVSYADYDYIDLTNPFLRKIPLAPRIQKRPQLRLPGSLPRHLTLRVILRL